MSTYAFISTHSSIVASMETVISMKAFSIGFTRAKNITRTPRKAANCPSFLLHGKHTFSTRNTIACSWLPSARGRGGGWREPENETSCLPYLKNLLHFNAFDIHFEMA